MMEPSEHETSPWMEDQQKGHNNQIIFRVTEQRLGLSLVLSRTVDAETVVVVDNIKAWCACAELRVGDALVSIDGQEVAKIDDESKFQELVAWISGRPRPMELEFKRSTRQRAPRTDAVALREYERRCEAELDGKAAYNASILRARGLGGKADDVAAALLLLRKSASLGVVRAQLQLAKLYATGRGGVKRDADEAFRWYSEAAAQNDPEALYSLGCIYADTGAPDAKPDDSEALWCFFRAAKLGRTDAQQAAERIVQRRQNRAPQPSIFRDASLSKWASAISASLQRRPCNDVDDSCRRPSFSEQTLQDNGLEQLILSGSDTGLTHQHPPLIVASNGGYVPPSVPYDSACAINDPGPSLPAQQTLDSEKHIGELDPATTPVPSENSGN